MNFSIHLDKKTFDELVRTAKHSGMKRNAIISQAVKEWLTHHHQEEWPKSVLTYKGIKGFKPFESHRSELKPPKDVKL